MSKLKVLHIVWSTNTGGIERLVLRLWKSQLEDENLDVSVYAGQPEGRLWNEFLAVGKVMKGLFRNGTDFSISKIQKTKKVFEQYDVLHFHSFHPATALAAVQSGKKIIYTEHGNFAFGRKLRISDHVIRQLMKYFLRTKCSYVTFNSEFSKNTAIHRYGLSGNRMKVIYNGIPDYFPTSAPDKDIREFTAGHFTIGFVGRLTAVKRVDRLIDTGKLLQRKTDFRMVIIGEGPLKATLQQSVQESGLSSAVFFAGERSDVRRFYPHFDAFVLPSSHEAFGLVVAEALYAGTPCYVFSDAGGPVELISRQEPQNICSSPSDLAEKLYHLSFHKPEEPEKKKRMETAKLFSILKMEESFKQLYTGS